MTVIALDPGNEKTAWIVWDGRVINCGIDANDDLLAMLEDLKPFDVVAIEMVSCYGMKVGREVFETCVWIGRFQEALWRSRPVLLVYRQKVKKFLGCGNGKDKHVRAALIRKFGEPGTKKNPGPLHGISSHLWAALAVADYALSIHKQNEI